MQEKSIVQTECLIKLPSKRTNRPTQILDSEGKADVESNYPSTNHEAKSAKSARDILGLKKLEQKYLNWIDALEENRTIGTYSKTRISENNLSLKTPGKETDEMVVDPCDTDEEDPLCLCLDSIPHTTEEMINTID
jgi:hypothetical protein